ncbi:hypothetical protein [Hymenobacter sp. 102]|uniref:hypothetical protein n=1 Tax=Hymenobacter sp. 102 TaxID=3403152 RepID=UPI003CEB62C3
MSTLTLRAKHWQVFLLTVILLTMMHLTIEDQMFLSGIMGAVGYCLYFIWFAVLGNTLFPLLPRDADYSLTWFLIDIILVAASLSALLILVDSRSYQAEGIATLPMLYIFFAMLHGPWFLAAALVAVEKKRKPEFGFYFGTLLLFLFWPVGVWFIQPRLNKLLEEAEWEKKALEELGTEKQAS